LSSSRTWKSVLHNQRIKTHDLKIPPFKVDVRNAESLAAEMAAFANSEGGQVLLGVGDDGSTLGLAAADISRINQLISNAAS
jgi:predicted HTH transcriptional regulator